jgi:hypothetical protein
MGAGDAHSCGTGDASDTVEVRTEPTTSPLAQCQREYTISANGERALSRDVANVTMDINSVENIDLHALGGTDTIMVNDLSERTSAASIDLAASTGGGDGQVDTIVINQRR